MPTPPELNAAYSLEKAYHFASGAIDPADFSSQFYWGNGQKTDELGYYTGGDSPNRKVVGGTLHLKAIREPITPWPGLTLEFTTGQITTYPNATYPDRLLVQPPSTTTGGVFIELSMQAARAKGLVSAAYLLPADGNWPPEIDIVEVVGQMNDWYHGTIHWSATGQTQVREKTGLDLAADFHRYGVLWEADRTTFYLDGVALGSVQHHVPSVPMRLLVGLSVGSTWAGPPEAAFTSDTMQVDWINIWRKA